MLTPNRRPSYAATPALRSLEDGRGRPIVVGQEALIRLRVVQVDYTGRSALPVQCQAAEPIPAVGCGQFLAVDPSQLEMLGDQESLLASAAADLTLAEQEIAGYLALLSTVERLADMSQPCHDERGWELDVEQRTALIHSTIVEQLRTWRQQLAAEAALRG